MAKQLNVSLAFTADTSQAKKALQDLQTALNSIINNTTTKTSGLGLTKELMKATESAIELKSILSSSTTRDGLLDLGVFNQQLTQSGKKLQDYANDLNSLGPSGQQAFANISRAITLAEMPLRRTNGLLMEFATTLKNTARWQLSSSLLHGFMGAVSEAYNYAQDLNKSLNDIRIVTGQSSEQMAEFAEKANESAKALSTTTTEYTKASLIYYQQGLSDEAVKERTDITIKMANAAGQNAEIVSDQLTAVWNNFDDGTKSLEYYADVMTALGAATASSTDEIAGGLEKFAAIGETIGLSYEYAAAALATITSNTRQSEEVVGTALKTIFARIQGLKLGETLDDGTTLNKYSQALQNVGISIYDSQGELKKMDDILDEMASKWQSLSNAQQVALAQTVAGVRQYTQLVSLMDNWDVGDNDSMMANLDTAYNSTGALQEQADIYAESWEAAQDRVTAAAENIYQTLLDDKFFIGLTNAFGDFLDVIGGLIDGLGGLPGVLSLVGTLLFKAFGPQISTSISNLFYNLTYNTETAKQELFELRQEAVAAMRSLGDESIAGSASVDIFVKQGDLQDQLLLKSRELEQSGRSLTEEEKKRAQLLMDTTDHIGQQVLKTAELRQEQESITQTLINRLSQESMGKVEDISAKVEKVKSLQVVYSSLGPIIEQCKNEMQSLGENASEEEKARAFKSITSALTETQRALIETGVDFDLLDKESKETLETLFKVDGITFEKLKMNLTNAGDQINEIGVDAQRSFNELKKALMSVEGVDSSVIKKILDDLKISLSQTGKLTADQIQLFKNFGIAVDETGRIINNFNGKTLTFADGVTALGSSLMSLSTAINSVIGLTKIWTNESLSTGEKILQTLTTVAMLLPALTSLLNKENLAKLKGLLLDKEKVKINLIKIFGLKAETVAEVGLTKAIWAKIAAQMMANWYYAAAIAIILAVVATVSILINKYNEEANAAEAAAEKAKSLKEAYDETQQAAENLKTTINDYQDAIDTMNKLEKGTLEYKQALLDANEQALELISQYKILSQYATRDSEGRIIISQEGFDAVLEEQLRAASDAQSRWLNAEIAASQLQEDSDLINFSREYSVKGEDDWEKTSEKVVRAIASYLKENDLNGLIEDDLDKIKGWGDLSEDVQSHIRENISAYSDMGVSLNNTNDAQNILTEAYLDAAWRLNHPEEESNSDPADNTASILEGSLFNTYTSKALSDSEIAKWQEDYLNDKLTGIMEDEGWTDLGQAVIAPDVYVATATYGNRASLDQANEYAALKGYGSVDFADVDAATSWDYFWNTLSTDDSKPTTAFQFYDENGKAIGDPIDNVELMDLLAKETEARIQAEKAKIDVPEVMGKLDNLVSSLGDMGTSSFQNFLASGTVTTNADGTRDPKFALEAAGMSQEEALYIKENWDTVVKQFSGVAEDMGFWTEMGFQDYEEYLQYAKNWIDKRAEQSDADAFGLERLTTIQNKSNSVEDQVLSGDLTSANAKENTDYIEMTKGANLLAQAYPELIEEAKLLSNTNLIGTEMWMEALHKVQEQADSLKLDGLIAESDKVEKKIADMFKNLNSQADIEATLLSDEFETELESLLDKNYEIDIEIHAQAEQAFESFDAAANNMRDMASKIGEGYVVAAEDIRELNAVFPGIIQGMQSVGDGSVRLNQQVVENAMNSANAEIQASGQSTIEQLENQSTILRAKQSSYLAMYEAALALSKGEGDASVHTATLKTELMNIEALNDKEAADTKMDNAESVATDSNVQAGIMAQNWDSAYQSAAKSAIEFAKTAVSAAEAAQTGKATYSMGDFGVNYQGRNGQSSEAAKLAEFESAVDNASTADDYAELAQSFLEAANSAGAKANDIEGMIAEIGATYVDFDHLIDNVADGKGSKGGGGSNKKEIKELTEIAERYHEITREIKALEHELDLVNKEKERAFGANYIKALEKEIQTLEALKQKQNELYKAQIVFLASDRQAVLNTFSGAKFDSEGNISNYSSLVQSATDEYNRAITTYNNSSQSESDKEILEKAKEKYEDQIEVLKQYEETLDATKESEAELQEIHDKWQTANFEKLSYELELKITINDNELKKLEYYLSKTEDNFFQMAEAAALMVSKGGQLDVYKDNLANLEEQAKKLEQAYKDGKISQAAFEEGMQEIYDGIYDNLGNIQQLDSAMRHYYEDTLAAAGEEIGKVTTRMEHQTAVLEHYQSLIKIMGKTNDYEAMGVVLEGQSKTIKNSMDAAKASWEMYQEEAKKKEEQYRNAKTEEEKEFYKKEWDAALDAADQAQEEYLAKAEEYAESLKAILENSLNQYAQTLENALTGGTSFDQLTTQMERAASIQEEYLTTTNKIYETNKLMNQAQQEIDKSTNSVAQRRLKQFINETDQLQKKNKLSQYELEIQQAKYDLLLAEIALEEAQDAKSTVRLQRDSEGNFGYVYTADQSKVDEAAQKLADAQNALYNIALEGANGYTEKYQQTLNDMYSTLTDLQQQYLDGAFESEEEYHAAMEAAKAYYYEKLEQYSSLHSVAISTDARVIEDAWSSEFSQMVYSTGAWKTSVNTYINDVNKAFTAWQVSMNTLASETGVGGSLNTLTTKVGEVKTASDQLLITLIGEDGKSGLIGEIKNEFTEVTNVTSAYAAQITTLQGVITEYENLATAIQNKKKAELDEEKKDPPKNPPKNPNGEGNNDEENDSITAPALSIGTAVSVKSGVKWYYDSYGTAPTGTARGGNIKYINEKGSHPYNIDGLGWIKKTDIVGYDTGGYTGSWGSYGKLGVLHEKEMVLNEKDTQNFLTSMEFLDNIIKTIDLQAANSQFSGLLSSPSFGNFGTGETLEQNVTIEANFPNVSSRQEIEEAFTTLVNRASQYANRK